MQLALQDPVQSDVHSTSGETELALPHGTLAPNSAFAVCKVCDQQVPKAEIMAHVVQCSALASCHERLREVDSGLKRTVVVLGARHTQLQMAVDDLRSQIGTLRKLQQLLSDVASIRVIGGKASPSSAAKHIEQLLERHEHALIEDAAKWSKRSPAIMALWEKVRRLPRSKLSVCWDVLTVDDPAGKGGAKTSATGVAHKVSMKDFDIVDVLGSGGYGVRGACAVCAPRVRLALSSRDAVCAAPPPPLLPFSLHSPPPLLGQAPSTWRGGARPRTWSRSRR